VVVVVVVVVVVFGEGKTHVLSLVLKTNPLLQILHTAFP